MPPHTSPTQSAKPAWTRLANSLVLRLKLFLERDANKRQVLRWWLDDPDEERRYAYALGPGSVVLDLGGFRGDWTREILRRYGSQVHVFEPVPAFAADLERQFAVEPRVRVHHFGLSDRDGDEAIIEAADASSTVTGTGTAVMAHFRDVVGVFETERLTDVALVKINIEGGEYPLLRRMIEANLVSRCGDIQVQFHAFVANAEEQRDRIRAELRRTHILTYDYPFVWENWHRK